MNNEQNPKSWLGQTVKVKIDRPLGSAHPQFPQSIYPVNYGFVPGTFSPIDREEIDAYVLGPNKPRQEFSGQVIAVICRIGNEIKLIVSDGRNYSDRQIRQLTDFQEKYFQSEIIR
jgi:inorganic pyrophosphatase